MADDLLVRIDASTAGYEAGMARARAATMAYESQIAKTGLALATLEKEMNADALAATRALEQQQVARRQAMASLGTAAGTVGLVAAAGVAVAVKSFADFDKSMSAVEAATHETAGGMEQLRQAALKAGADTVFSATEAADGITAMAKAGVRTKDILAGGLTGALDLAAAGSLDVASAADIAATTLNQFNLAGEDVPHVADVLAAAAGKAQGEVTDMAAALKYVGPVASQMGVSLEESAGSIALLASQGILGEQAGTGLRGVLSSLTSPSQQAADEMKRLGINMYDARGQFIGLDGVAEQLQQNMRNLSAAERDQALGRIFGNAQVTTARILYAGGAEAVDKWTRAVNDQGFAAETAATKLDNLSGDLEALKGSLETALIGTGEGANGPLRSLVQNLTDLVNAYNGLPGPVKQGVLALGAFTAVMGGGVWAFSKAVGGLSNLRTNLGLVTEAAPRTAGALRGLTGAAIGVSGLIALNDVLTRLQESSNDAVPGINSVGVELLTLARGGVPNITHDFDDLAGSIDRIANKSWDENLFDVLPGPEAAALGQTLGEAEADISALDQALADLVARGATKEAARGLEALAESQNLSAGQTRQLTELLPLYEEALAGVRGQALLSGEANKSAARAAEHYYNTFDPALVQGNAQGHRRTANALNDEARAAEETEDAVAKLNSEYVTGLTRTLDFNAAVRDANKQLSSNTASLNKNTDAGEETWRTIIAMAEGLGEFKAGTERSDRAVEKFSRTIMDNRENLNLTKGEARDLIADFLKFPAATGRAGDGVDRFSARSIDALTDTKGDVDVLDKAFRDLPRETYTRAEFDTAQAIVKARSMIGTINNILGDIDDEKVDVELSSQAAKVAAQLKMAEGGPVPWRPGAVHGKDSVRADLVPDEHVVDLEAVRGAGGGNVQKGHKVWAGLRMLARNGELTRHGDLGIPGYAAGGPVVEPSVSQTGAASAAAVVEQLFQQIAASLTDQLSDAANDFFTAMPMGGIGNLGAGGSLAPAQIVRGQNFAKAQAGKPYSWGAAGPGAYDCSGFQAAILNAARGVYPYQRIGTTASMPWPGFSGGSGSFSIANDPGSHMAGAVGGMGTESRGGDGVVLGGGITPLGSFAQMWKYDSGGMMRPGQGGVNQSGKPEAVLDPEQTQAFNQLVRALVKFDPRKGTASEVKSDVRGFYDALKDMLGKDSNLLKRIDGLGERIVDLTRKQDQVTRSLERQITSQDALRERQDAFAAEVAGNFRTDILAVGTTLHDAMLQGRADANDADAFRQKLNQAEEAGLSGSAYRSAAASGNLALLKELLAGGGDRKAVTRLERVLARQQSASAQLGRVAGREVFSDRLKENAREIHHLRKELHRYNDRLHERDKAYSQLLRKAVREGTRDGSRQGSHEGTSSGRRANSRFAAAQARR